MYVCLCNGLTDQQIRNAASSGNCRLKEVYGACGCAAQCGNCAKTILGIIRDNSGHELNAAPGD
ncbi:(2Fe-2S)-binding protein [Acetobacteraceae bacterium H6797]|nr:(2Fe-2S)-binding protein [Acetobacteraceae bacterium H6797]